MELTAPDFMPQLTRGAHRSPREGACFMEYTSLLAGQPFSDHPACTDISLGGVMMSLNDRLSDDQRTLLVPLLGRAIGLRAPTPQSVPGVRTEVMRRWVGKAAPSGADIWMDGARSGWTGVLEQIVRYRLPDANSRSMAKWAPVAVEVATQLHEAWEEVLAEYGVAKAEPQRSHAEVRRELVPLIQYQEFQPTAYVTYPVQTYFISSGVVQPMSVNSSQLTAV